MTFEPKDTSAKSFLLFIPWSALSTRRFTSNLRIVRRSFKWLRKSLRRNTAQKRQSPLESTVTLQPKTPWYSLLCGNGCHLASISRFTSLRQKFLKWVWQNGIKLVLILNSCVIPTTQKSSKSNSSAKDLEENTRLWSNFIPVLKP